jgi:hypothetical protein
LRSNRSAQAPSAAHGEILDEGSLPPADRQRLTQINGEILRTATRIRSIRRVVLTIWTAVGLLVLGVADNAVAVTAR